MTTTVSLSHVDAVTRLGFALSDDVRTRILLALRGKEAYPSELAAELGVSRQVMSNQLSCLRGCGFVRARREGRRVAYSLVSPHLAAALDELLAATLAIDPSCCGPDASCRVGAGTTCACCGGEEL